MENLDPIQFGKLINAVETLSQRVADLDAKVTALNDQVSRGRGMIIGMFVAAGGLGAGATKVLENLIR